MSDTATNPQFIHLHVHSAYSLAEGAIKIPKLLDLCVGNNMPAVAVTDTNNMFGAMDFALSAVKRGLQPIIGTQLDVFYDNGEPQTPYTQARPNKASIVLLVQSEGGYKNLCKIISRSYMNKESNAPTGIHMDALKGLTDGLICLSGGPRGPIGKLLLDDKLNVAKGITDQFLSLFDGRFYIELMRHGDWNVAVDQEMISIAMDKNIPLVATNDCYFASPKMHEAHDALLCIAGSTYVMEKDRRRETRDHYFKSQDEMVELFSDVPEAIHNTVQIAKRCHFILKPVEVQLPESETKQGRSEAQEMRAQSESGLEWRLEKYVYTDDMDQTKKDELRAEYYDRLEMELGIIEQMGYPGYFLIVADFIQWAKDHDIPVGPGRGSGAGSIVAWAMKITDLDPIFYGLLFERFLNPERVSMPDFDVDFCQSRRDEVIKYVQQKYGRDRVGQIITFGKLQARAVVRDVGRVLQMSYGQVDRISKMIPANPANPVTLAEAVDGDPELQRLRDEDETVGRLIKIALELEGLYRHASTHAAGIVIGNKPLEDIVPMYQDARSDMPATQYNLKYVELASLVKFDFLGLKTLTVLQTALKNIKQTTGDDIDLLALPMHDEKTYNLMAKGYATGVFQFESSGMQDVLRKARPECLEDLIALNSLYRPGPMDNIPDFVANKLGEQEIVYPHEKLEDLLKETYGIMVYQEQVMEAARILAGYSLGGADLLRRAMGKKIKAEMDSQRALFVKGCAEVSNIPEQQANDIFDLIAKFAGYGFNKSHAGAYSLIAYQTAYLKANYPVEFMAALMTLDMGNTDKINFYRQDLRRMNIELLPPDINKSFDYFAVEETPNGKAVRYAFAALKGAGQQAMEALVATRIEGGEFSDIKDFIRRVDVRAFSKKQLEILSCAGAFDRFNIPRACIHMAADYLMRQANQWNEEKVSGQVSLFGMADETEGWSEDLCLPDRDEWDDLEKLQMEFSAVGFYLSAHPLDTQAEALEKNGFKSFLGLKDFIMSKATNSHRVKIAGVIIKKQEKQSDRGRFAFVTLSDQTGLFDVTVYTDPLMEYRDILTPGNIMSMQVDATMRDEDLRLILRQASLLDAELVGRIRNVNIELNNADAIHDLSGILHGKPKGPIKINIYIPLKNINKLAKCNVGSGLMLQAEDLDALKRLKNATVSAI